MAILGFFDFFSLTLIAVSISQKYSQGSFLHSSLPVLFQTFRKKDVANPVVAESCYGILQTVKSAGCDHPFLDFVLCVQVVEKRGVVLEVVFLAE